MTTTISLETFILEVAGVLHSFAHLGKVVL